MKIVAIVSGGMDSVANLASWLGNEVYALSFNYGQKSQRELEVAATICRELKVPHRIINIEFMKDLWVGRQLTDEKVAVQQAYDPSVVVPLRNAIFVTIAMAYAYNIGASVVTYGSHLDDEQLAEDKKPMYPDSSASFALWLQEALWIGHQRGGIVEIITPGTQGLSKAENLKRGYAILGDLIFETWSCYEDGSVHCGKCKSCLDRKRAFAEAGIVDRTTYENP